MFKGPEQTTRKILSKDMQKIKETVRCSTLSRVELQVCSLLRINLSTKDIARLLNISVDSVDMNRHRIRTKLGLDPKDNLTGFLITL